MRAIIDSRNLVPSVCGPITKSVAAWLAGSVLAIFSGSALAHESDDVIVRGGAALVSPHESASPAIVGLSSNAQAGFSGTYMLTDSIGVGLLAATPFTHDVDLKGGNTLAEVTHLPPTISLQYYFETISVVTPYIGVGVNAFLVLDSDMTSYGRKTLGTNSISVDNSYGLALSAGVDVALSDTWSLNAGVWNIDVDTTANVNHGALKIDLDVDPWVYMLGVGYKF